MNKTQWTFLIIVLLAVFSLWVVWPQRPSNYLSNVIPWPERGWLAIKLGDVNFVRKGMTLGLDLQGGLDVVLQADLSQSPPGDQGQALEGARQVIERRVNGLGVAEPVIQTQG